LIRDCYSGAFSALNIPCDGRVASEGGAVQSLLAQAESLFAEV